jgi:cation diffusion facilitator family transporter
MARAAAKSVAERYAWLSAIAAVATIALKTVAWRLTGSVGLLSDALESLVNLAAALLAVIMLRLAAAPPDEDYQYGRFKAEYVASGVEGALIVFAAISIVWSAWPRLFAPQAINVPVLGLALSGAATAINLSVSLAMIRAGRRLGSIAVEADGRHLMTDVWTSVGVIAGVALTAATGWLILDPLIALAVALNIIWTGVVLMRRSFAGLLDAAIPDEEAALIEKIFNEYRQRYGVDFHALRTRSAASRRFITFHLLVPDAWTVARAHELSEEIEERIRELVENAILLTHIEPIGQAASYDDVKLERP